MRVRKAVIPVAGLGTRFLPATKAIPKEMIPIIDTPMIHYVVEEAIRSGISDVVLITARGKTNIVDYFDHAFEVEKTLEEKQKTELLEIARSVSSMIRVIAVRQKQPLGLGHAILCAKSVIGDEPFAVLLGDDLIVGPNPATKQMIDVYEKTGKSVVAVMEVEKSEVSKYGIVEGDKIGDGFYKATRLVEKPRPQDTNSNLAMPGRYILTPNVFDYLEKQAPGAGGEIQLTDALHKLATRDGLFAKTFEGTRYDTGDKIGYLRATLDFALKREDMASDVRKLIKEFANK